MRDRMRQLVRAVSNSTRMAAVAPDRPAVGQIEERYGGGAATRGLPDFLAVARRVEKVCDGHLDRPVDLVWTRSEPQCCAGHTDHRVDAESGMQRRHGIEPTDHLDHRRIDTHLLQRLAKGALLGCLACVEHAAAKGDVAAVAADPVDRLTSTT
jgi:hypothetical protein